MNGVQVWPEVVVGKMAGERWFSFVWYATELTAIAARGGSRLI